MKAKHGLVTVLLLVSVLVVAGCISTNTNNSEPASNFYTRAASTPFDLMYTLNSSLPVQQHQFTISSNYPDVSLTYLNCYRANRTIDQLPPNQKFCTLLNAVWRMNNTIEGDCLCYTSE